MDVSDILHYLIAKYKIEYKIKNIRYGKQIR